MNTLVTSTLLALSALVSAQEPPALSPLLIQPGLDSRVCIQPAGGSSAPGTKLVVAECTGSTAQEFFFSNHQIRVFSNQCVSAPSTTNGAQLEIQTCDPSQSSQLFYYNFFNHNQLALLNTRSKCIDLASGSLTPGNKVQIWDCSSGNHNQVWNVGYEVGAQPFHSESGQTGNNDCGSGSSQGSNCQTLWLNSLNDFCLFAPPNPNSSIGATEQHEIAWCTLPGHGTRVMPPGTLTGVHFVKTKDYIQFTGVGDFTKINVLRHDPGGGGELDPHGATGTGNPVGGLVYGNAFSSNLQFHEWTEFIDDTQFCIRACIGPNAAENCNHIYDELGCMWNMPGNYDNHVFESCEGDDDLPMGVYGTSTFHQGQSATPAAHPAAPSSECQRVATVPTGTGSSTGGGPTPPPTSGAHAIEPKASSAWCLNAASNTDGAFVTIEKCNQSSNQKWTQSGSTLSVFGSKCLDVTNGVNADGTKMQIWDCGSGKNANQQFTLSSAGQFTWSGKGKCLDLTDGKLASGNQVQVWTCSSGNKNQIWNLA